jgi:hypothetical protein
MERGTWGTGDGGRLYLSDDALACLSRTAAPNADRHHMASSSTRAAMMPSRDRAGHIPSGYKLRVYGREHTKMCPRVRCGGNCCDDDSAPSTIDSLISTTYTRWALHDLAHWQRCSTSWLRMRKKTWTMLETVQIARVALRFRPANRLVAGGDEVVGELLHDRRRLARLRRRGVLGDKDRLRRLHEHAAVRL